jgi:hypothetical protein
MHIIKKIGKIIYRGNDMERIYRYSKIEEYLHFPFCHLLSLKADQSRTICAYSLNITALWVR